VTLETKASNAVTSLPDSVVIMVGVQRPGADAIADYRDSLNRCQTFAFTDPQTSKNVVVSQDLEGNKNFADQTGNQLFDLQLALKVTQNEDGKRAIANWVTLVKRHDIVIKAMASEYNSSDLSDNSVQSALQKIGPNG
jgi:hypothetical protein